MAAKDLIKSSGDNQLRLPEGQLVLIPPGFMLATGNPSPPPEAQSHLWDYLSLIWRKRSLVELIFLLGIAMAVLLNHRAVPIYQATAKMRIEPEEPKIVSFRGEEVALAGARKGPEFINTQMQILSSHALAQKVMERLKLFNAQPPEPLKKESVVLGALRGMRDKAFMLLGLESENNPQRLAGRPISKKEYETLVQQARVGSFFRKLDVRQLRDTELVSIGYSSPDPRQSALIVNTLCEEYIKWTYESKDDSYNYAREWIQGKLSEMKGRLEQSEKELLQLTGGKDFISDSDAQLPAQLESLRQKVAEAERNLFDREFELQRYSSEKDFAALQSAGDVRLSRLLESAALNQIEYDKATIHFGPNSREVRSLKAERDAIRGQLHEAFVQARRKVQLAYDQAKSSFDYARKVYDTEKGRIGGIQKDLIQYNILKREVDVNRELYNTLLQRGKEIHVTTGVKVGYASVVDPAVVPLTPAFPNKPRTLALGALIGLFMGVGLIFFLDYMDTSVKDPEELERLTRLPLLGYVSHCQFQRGLGRSRLRIELMTHQQPRSEFAESIRALRTSIQYSQAENAPQVIMVTSCLPGEGKTTIATNLAIAMASLNKQVLLIDADLKKPSLSRLFDLNRSLGLPEILSGKMELSELPESGIPNLSVISSLTRPANPVELLDSKPMRRFLESATQQYDQIIIDAAPSMNLADAAVLAPYVDGVVLVIRPGKTPREAVRVVRERLQQIQGNMLGIVANNPAWKAGQRFTYHYGSAYGNGVARRRRWRSEAHGTARGVQEVVDISAAARQLNPPPRDWEEKWHKG